MDINKITKKIDAFQQQHAVLGFPHAVTKKYGEDNGGYQAALLTYYGFLSLFPLLLVLLTILRIWFQGDPSVQGNVSTSVGHFFPLLGSQLQHNIHGMSKAGLGLVIGILFTLYGARGSADALRYSLDNIWQVPKSKRAGFPKNILHSLAIMGGAAAGFAAIVAVSAFTSALGHATWVKVLANILGFGILTMVFGYIFQVATNWRIRYRYMFLGAAIAAGMIQLLLSFGGILVAHELRNLDTLYGTFAVVLGMLFWIYLIAQIVMYAAEIDTVRHFKLYPRSSSGRLLTDADKRANKLYTS
jgi:YihY family inner membrane protein